MKKFYINVFDFFYRERLIHVLALRPYKKPELFDRFYKGKDRLTFCGF